MWAIYIFVMLAMCSKLNMSPVKLAPISKQGRSWWAAGIARSREPGLLSAQRAAARRVDGGNVVVSGAFSRFNLGSFEGSTRKAILVVCDTTKTT
jgi:hypothetical protein